MLYGYTMVRSYSAIETKKKLFVNTMKLFISVRSEDLTSKQNYDHVYIYVLVLLLYFNTAFFSTINYLKANNLLLYLTWLSLGHTTYTPHVTHNISL
jgi:hypothetical protein